MARYKSSQKYPRIPRRIWFLLVGIICLMIVGAVVVRQIYYKGLEPVSTNQSTQIFTVERGANVKQIASDLEEAKLIRSAWAMQLYIHSKELGEKLQAGTYALSPSQSAPEIVTTLTKGKVATRLVTILPGRRIDQVRADLINSGFAPNAVDRALVPNQYSDLPVMAFKPTDVNTLEGLLWPNSYQKDSSTSPSTIIRASLIEMGQKLTAEVQADFAAQGLTTYQGLILASVVLQEVGHPEDQTQAAQVFLTRLKSGMMLGSDVTAKYGSVLAGREPDVAFDSIYSTSLHTDLPPTPISTINESSLFAATHPAATSWLYFVSGDDGTTHFSSTLEEHEALTKKYCTKLCGN